MNAADLHIQGKQDSSLSLQEVQAKNRLWNWITGSLPTVKETILRWKGDYSSLKREGVVKTWRCELLIQKFGGEIKVRENVL